MCYVLGVIALKPGIEDGVERPRYPQRDLHSAFVIDIHVLLRNTAPWRVPIRWHRYIESTGMAAHMTGFDDRVYCILVMGHLTPRRVQEIEVGLQDVDARITLPVAHGVIEGVLKTRVKDGHGGLSSSDVWHILGNAS